MSRIVGMCKVAACMQSIYLAWLLILCRVLYIDVMMEGKRVKLAGYMTCCTYWKHMHSLVITWTHRLIYIQIGTKLTVCLCFVSCNAIGSLSGGHNVCSVTSYAESLFHQHCSSYALPSEMWLGWNGSVQSIKEN